MISYTFDNDFKPRRRRNIMNDTNAFTCFFQYLTLFNMYFPKTFKAACCFTCLFVGSRVTAPFCQCFFKSHCTFFGSAREFIRVANTGHQFTADGSKAKTA